MVRYSYLWRSEHLRGQEEGLKGRPCAVVLLLQTKDGDDIVTVLPITHTPPSRSEADLAIEIPPVTKRRLGLDDERSWVVLTEASRFVWHGPDLRLARNGGPSSVVCGLLPEHLFERLRTTFLTALKARRSKLVLRAE